MKTRLLHLGPDATRPVGPAASKANPRPKRRRPRAETDRLPQGATIEGWIA